MRRMIWKQTLVALVVGAFTVNFYPGEVKAEPNLSEASLISAEAEMSQSSIWNHLRADFSMDHQRYAPGVAKQRELYLKHAYHLNLLLKRSAPYIYFINEELEKRNLPAELVLLPLIESAYDPYAVSKSNAAGLWQIIPGTGRSYGLKQNHWYDGRHDIYASTQAALDYLTALNKLFHGNWPLTIAAYNSGEGNIQRAINYNLSLAEPIDFWSLRVAAETRLYVQRFYALADIIANSEKYHIELPYIPNHPNLILVKPKQQMDLRRVAEIAGISINKLYLLNAGYRNRNAGTTPPNGPHHLLLPINQLTPYEQVAKLKEVLNSGCTKAKAERTYLAQDFMGPRPHTKIFGPPRKPEFVGPRLLYTMQQNSGPRPLLFTGPQRIYLLEANFGPKPKPELIGPRLLYTMQANAGPTQPKFTGPRLLYTMRPNSGPSKLEFTGPQLLKAMLPNAGPTKPEFIGPSPRYDLPSHAGPKPKPKLVGPKLLYAMEQNAGPQQLILTGPQLLKAMTQNAGPIKPEFTGPQPFYAGQSNAGSAPPILSTIKQTPSLPVEQSLIQQPKLLSVAEQNQQLKLIKTNQIIPTTKPATLSTSKPKLTAVNHSPKQKTPPTAKPAPTNAPTTYTQPRTTHAVSATSHKNTTLVSGSRINYRVQPGETLMDVAANFNISPQQILRWNSQINGNSKLYAGQRLTIYKG